MGVFAQPDVYLKKIEVKKKRPELEKIASEENQDEIIKGAGLAALGLATKGDTQAKPSLIQSALKNAIAAGDKEAVNTLSEADALHPMTVGATIGTGDKNKLLANIPSNVPSGKKGKERLGSKPKGSSLADFGRGLVEGVLGMPESVEGSSSRIPYALGQLPGTLARTKIGLPTSGEATHSAMQQATMPQYRQQEIGQAKVKQEIEAAQLPGYEESLNNAVRALQKTKDPEKIRLIYQKISAAYPSKSAELKRILLLNEKETISDILAAARGL